MMTNAASALPYKIYIKIYCVSDVLVRALSYGGLAGAIIVNGDINDTLALLPFLMLYINRGVLMSSLYISRGFIYPPDNTCGLTKDNTTIWKKVVFGFFPAGFVQTFTDFPFNGDLATNKRFFAGHQCMSLCESLVCMLLAIF